MIRGEEASEAGEGVWSRLVGVSICCGCAGRVKVGGGGWWVCMARQIECRSAGAEKAGMELLWK